MRQVSLGLPVTVTLAAVVGCTEPTDFVVSNESGAGAVVVWAFASADASSPCPLGGDSSDTVEGILVRSHLYGARFQGGDRPSSLQVDRARCQARVTLPSDDAVRVMRLPDFDPGRAADRAFASRLRIRVTGGPVPLRVDEGEVLSRMTRHGEMLYEIPYVGRNAGEAPRRTAPSRR